MHRDHGDASDRLRIGLIAPPWVPVPPTGYGGTEAVIDVLARGLQAAGHKVVLFATGDSTCPVETLSHYAVPSEPIGTTIAELAHVRSAYAALAGCDVIHDHTVAGLVWAAARPPSAALVVTNHGEFSDDLQGLYADLAEHASIVAISASQAATARDLPIAAVIHHGVEATTRAVGSGSGGYLAFVGRMHPHKGVHRAIAIARASGMPLRIAARTREPVEREYFHQVVEPLLGDGIDYLGEISPAARDHMVGEAQALLNPIRWPEPFGMVMIEALAVGTPVIAYPSGAAAEIVTHGVTGFLVQDVGQAAAAVHRVRYLDRAACRRAVEGPFSAARMVADHERVYRAALRRRSPTTRLIELDLRQRRSAGLVERAGRP